MQFLRAINLEKADPNPKGIGAIIAAADDGEIMYDDGGVVGCPLLAQSRHGRVHCTCPLSGVKRTCLFALQMSAYDPKRTWASADN